MNTLSAPVWEIANQMEQSWQAAAERWQDITATEYEEQYWLPLAAATMEYITAARELDELLAAIRMLANEWE